MPPLVSIKKPTIEPITGKDYHAMEKKWDLIT